tara:strand:+ start:95 stop:2239 length:2145 start_codon:yes stop_codon:yes gene_type:complete
MKLSNIQTHLNKLRSYQHTDDDMLLGKNKLYFLEVIEKPGKVKVGDTRRFVETRNKETMINASLHRSKPVTWVLAEKWDGKVFRDKKFHKFLTDKEYERELNDEGGKSEWFYITLEQALAELEEFTGKPVYREVQLRPAQTYLREEINKAIADGHDHINAGLCVRVGKTIISLTVSADQEWMPVYIGKNLTSQASAEKDNDDYGIVPEMLTQSIHGDDGEELADDEVSKKVKKIIAKIKRVNKNKKKIFFFVDEVDDASHTKKSRDVITPVIEHFKKLDMFGAFITMSGTRIYRGEKVLKELTNGTIKEISLEYYEMQVLQPETTCNRNYRHISFYSEKATGLVNISDAMKTTAGHKSLATVIENLLGINDFEIEINPAFPHWFIKITTGGLKNNANKLVRYLNRNYSTIENREYFFAVINGDVTISKEAEVYCKRIIKEQTGKVVVFITQGMATTSFSVEEIGNSAVFTDNELTTDDVQALHRSATWADGKTHCNMAVITTNDSNEFTFDDIFEDETKLAKSRLEKIEIYKELLNNNSMVHFVQGKSLRPVVVTKHNVKDVIDTKMKAMTKIASIVGSFSELDEDVLYDILANMSVSKLTSKKSGTDKPDTFDPFGKSTETGPMTASSDNITLKAKEKVLRAFVEAAVSVPAIAKEQETSMENLNNWDGIGISKELFFNVYDSTPGFKDRLDTIFNLCSDEEYLVENYINNLI